MTDYQKLVAANIHEAVYANVKHGWLTLAKTEALFAIYLTNKPEVAVESGVFWGMSAIAQGLIVRHLNLNTKIYAIDAWDNSICTEGTNSTANNDWWMTQDLDLAHASFLSFIALFELEDIVIPMKGKSVDVADKIPAQIDFFHQDSSHNAETITAEFETYTNRLQDGGIWMCDDFDWVEANAAYQNIYNYGFTMIDTVSADGQTCAIFEKGNHSK